ncbi:hypothetical protein [Ramlibacter sp.]|uniref:hypothetical protein n=1 Tax=Ramlibacter sp. TaxID=1917967 RepID=UPI002D79D7AB|nr:hypothetical protein [Ramlibacter sp.]
MPATPAHQDPLQDCWRLEDLTPDVRRRLFERTPLRTLASRNRREGPALPLPPRHTERPLSH